MDRCDRAFITGAALLDLTEREVVLEVCGPDSEDFLQRMISCDVRKTTTDGSSAVATPGTLMTGKGKLIAVFDLHRVSSEGPRFWLVVERSAVEHLREALERLVILEDVTIEEPDLSVLSVQGPKATEALIQIGITKFDAITSELNRSTRDVEGVGTVSVIKKQRSVAGGWDLIVTTPNWPKLQERLLASDAVELVTDLSIDAHRVLAGIPRFGIDASTKNLPPEVGYDAAVADGKGCFSGQEVVARIRTYGHVNRRLVQVESRGAELPAIGAEIYSSENGERGKSVGLVTSSAVDPQESRGIALAFVRYKKAVVGEPLFIEETEARILRVVGD